MKFFKKRNKTLKYIEKLALENVENKKRIAKLEEQLCELTTFGVKMAERLKDLDNAGNIDERLTYLENEQLDRDAIEDIVDDRLPSNIEDVCCTYDEYDFSEFITMSDMEDELRCREYVTLDELNDEIASYFEENKYDLVNEIKKDAAESTAPKWDDPEMFMLFLNKLARYVVEQTNNNT